jgi:hypothetical protein
MENKEKKEKSLKLSNFFPRFLLVALFLIGATMDLLKANQSKELFLIRTRSLLLEPMF